MTYFKVGDKVQYNGTDDVKIDYLEGHQGTIVAFSSRGNDAAIKWDAPLPIFPYSEEPEPVTWPQYMQPKSLTLVKRETEYDKATVDAIVAHLRAKGMFEIPNAVEEAFEEMTAPKTHKVVVIFEFEEGEDIVAILDRTDIDYTIKEG